MNYNDGKWHGWNGGECPVHPETVVDVTTWSDYDFEQNKSSKGVIGINAYRSIAAGKILWRDIIAFRVIKEHKEPREFWIETIHGELPAVWLHKPDLSDHPHYNGVCIHVREVQE